MATPIALNEILITQAVCFLPDESQIALNNRHWKVATISTPGIVTFKDVARELEAIVWSRYNVILQNAAEFKGVRCRKVDPSNTKVWESSNAHAGNGTGGAVGLPTQTCGLITFLSSDFGRAGEGRSYLPFPPSAANVGDGRPSAGYQTAARSLASSYATQLTVTGGTGGVYLLDPVLWAPATALTSRVILDFRVPEAWATQRRRGAYGKFNRLPF